MDEATERARVERSPKRVRVLLAGRPVADTAAPALVWERPPPTYYVPVADVLAELVPTGEVRRTPLGAATVYDVTLGGRSAAGAALRYLDSPELGDLVRLEWDAMDEWLEEDEPVYVHPRDPYSRVDVLASSRHVVVSVDGVTLADSRQPRMLFETGLPPRHYLPMADVRLELLRPSPTRTACPYKGTASYWTVDTGVAVHEDLAWTYRAPLPESQKIAGLICFYDEKVDVVVDGVARERPVSPFS